MGMIERRKNYWGGLRNGSVRDEQRPPDSVGPLALRKFPVLTRRGVRRPKKLGLEIMVSQEFINSPKSKFSERGRKQVGENVNERRASKHVFHYGLDLVARQHVGRHTFTL